ncbi:hypothetical protein Q4566_03020 [Tamlana sp. 2_MG-2023]|uniref:hypothetical protein n=1 Tax=unclassified Tamlana TaxID=2614803 RepID=UPI0026E2E96B|nr:MULTISPECIES: hypothetical protein [unclassified Tamlana]MDO6759159.1 hypothetical protein [Tamlana sp. 2_MG-2023]MDO6790702.1 hypothetical protein [Tamlana sp. 1_MG-2023]
MALFLTELKIFFKALNFNGHFFKPNIYKYLLKRISSISPIIREVVGVGASFFPISA